MASSVLSSGVVIIVMKNFALVYHVLPGQMQRELDLLNLRGGIW